MIEQLHLINEYAKYLSDKTNPPSSYQYWLANVYRPESVTYGDKLLTAWNNVSTGIL